MNLISRINSTVGIFIVEMEFYIITAVIKGNTNVDGITGSKIAKMTSIIKNNNSNNSNYSYLTNKSDITSRIRGFEVDLFTYVVGGANIIEKLLNIYCRNNISGMSRKYTCNRNNNKYY